MAFLAPLLLLPEQSTSGWHGINALPHTVTTSGETQALRVNLLSSAPVAQATPHRSEKTEALGGKRPARQCRRSQSLEMSSSGPWASSQLGHSIARKQKMPELTTKGEGWAPGRPSSCLKRGGTSFCPLQTRTLKEEG